MNGVPPPVSVVRHGGLAMVRLAGEVDLAAAEALERGIDAETAGATSVVVDLSAVGFLDSAGLRLLDRVVGKCDDRGAAVRLVVPEGCPARLPLDVCGFRPGLVADSVADALAGLPR